MTTPAPEHPERKPFWQVQGVFDSDASHRDFSYTLGLHCLGYPELHMWAKPCLGGVPEDDWALSSRDQVLVLNELAGLLIDGDIDVGSTIVRAYDRGLVKVTYLVDPPGNRAKLQAFRVPLGVDVLPVRWSLERQTEPPPTPLTTAAEKQARDLYAQIVESLSASAQTQQGWELPSSPLFDVDQRFGPLTPVVLARAAQLVTAEDVEIRDLLRAAVRLSEAGMTSPPIDYIQGLCRLVGRTSAAASLVASTGDLVEAMVPRLRSRGSRMLLFDVTLSCLGAEMVADVADEWLVLYGRGPWLASLSQLGIPPGPAWDAPPEVLATIGELIGSLDAGGLRAIAAAHVACRHSDASAYQRLCLKLEGLSLVSPAGCTWMAAVGCVLDSRCEELQWFERALVPMGQAHWPALQQWATCLAAALTYRQRLTRQEITVLVTPYAAPLPQLREVVTSFRLM